MEKFSLTSTEIAVIVILIIVTVVFVVPVLQPKAAEVTNILKK